MPQPETARPEDWPAAFALNFQHQLAAENATSVRDALTLLTRRELDPEGIFVLRENDTIVGVQISLALTGAMAIVWLPQCRDGPERIAREDCLLQHASSWLRQRGIKLAETLFPTDNLPDTSSLARNGFFHLTHLWYLRHDLIDLSAPPARL